MFVRWPDVAVSVEDQLAAVAVPLPSSNNLHVDALLDAARDEHAPKTALRVGREAEPLASVGQRLTRLTDGEQMLVRFFLVAQPFDQCACLWIDRNCERRGCLL